LKWMEEKMEEIRTALHNNKK